MTSGEMRLDATFVSRPERGEIGSTTAKQMTKISKSWGARPGSAPHPLEPRVAFSSAFSSLFQTGF